MTLKHLSISRIVANIIKVIIGQSIAHVSDWREAQIHTIIIVAVVIRIVIIYRRRSLRTVWIVLVKVPLIRSLFISTPASSFALWARWCHLRPYVLWRRINLNSD